MATRLRRECAPRASGRFSTVKSGVWPLSREKNAAENVAGSRLRFRAPRSGVETKDRCAVQFVSIPQRENLSDAEHAAFNLETHLAVRGLTRQTYGKP